MQVFTSQVRKISRKKSNFRRNFLITQPFWETGSILESLHHALPMKTKILNFEWVGGRECGKNCFGAMIYVWDHPGHPLSQISKIIFCSPPSYMIFQPPSKNKVIRWRSGLGVNTTTLGLFARQKCAFFENHGSTVFGRCLSIRSCSA
jgi:hypothetical protein